MVIPDPQKAEDLFIEAEVIRKYERMNALKAFEEAARKKVIKAMKDGYTCAYFGKFHIELWDNTWNIHVRDLMMKELQEAGWYVKKHYKSSEFSIDYDGYGVKWSKTPFKPWWKFW